MTLNIVRCRPLAWLGSASDIFHHINEQAEIMPALVQGHGVSRKNGREIDVLPLDDARAAL